MLETRVAALGGWEVGEFVGLEALASFDGSSASSEGVCSMT